MKQGILICLLVNLITIYGCKKDDIVKKDVVIEWSNPEDIEYGTPLGPAQLNATTSVAGTFDYNPPAGTVLDAGDSLYLAVEFTPDDAAHYNKAHKIVRINVVVNHQYGSMTDQSGNVYKTITIGTQTWMAENLRTNRYNNLNPIDSVSLAEWARETGAFCSYNSVIPENDAVYGKLYNWSAVNDRRKLAPTGWHVATDEDWKKLIEYLGGYVAAGGQMKEKGTVHWNAPNEGATNKSGFTALPGGARFSDTFSGLHTYGNWWSATPYVSGKAYFYYLNYQVGVIYRDVSYFECGYSVRCVKD
jgi:uncharacterized protein (TIGR02145 family)